MLEGNFKDVFYNLNVLLVSCVLGIIFVTQAFALSLCKMFITLILKIFRADWKLKPLIEKNVESHSLKNLHANLLYSVTICFLIF